MSILANWVVDVLFLWFVGYRFFIIWFINWLMRLRTKVFIFRLIHLFIKQFHHSFIHFRVIVRYLCSLFFTDDCSSSLRCWVWFLDVVFFTFSISFDLKARWTGDYKWCIIFAAVVQMVTRSVRPIFLDLENLKGISSVLRYTTPGITLSECFTS